MAVPSAIGFTIPLAFTVAISGFEVAKYKFEDSLTSRFLMSEKSAAILNGDAPLCPSKNRRSGSTLNCVGRSGLSTSMVIGSEYTIPAIGRGAHSREGVFSERDFLG